MQEIHTSDLIALVKFILWLFGMNNTFSQYFYTPEMKSDNFKMNLL